MDKPLNYEAVCGIVGHLVLESHLQMTGFRETIKQLHQEIDQARAERDAVLRTLLPSAEAPPQPGKGE